MTSENGKFNAKLSIAGELVVKMVQSSPEWRTNIKLDVDKGPYRLELDLKNELFVYNNDSEITWRSNTQIEHPLSKNGYLKMENNGKLTIYRGDGKPLWQSGTDEGTKNVLLILRFIFRYYT